MEFIYNRLEHCTLLDVLKNKEINQSLAYMVDFKKHKNLLVIPNTYSIEVSNDKITIIVILLIGFELVEYYKLKERTNVHIVSFNEACQTVFEFKKFKVMIDFAHNPSGYRGVEDFLSTVEATKKIGIIAGVGDRQRARRATRVEFDLARFDQEFARDHSRSPGRRPRFRAAGRRCQIMAAATPSAASRAAGDQGR